ncbi:MAG: translation initiation factor IF-2 N-terminal domain-containing protein, partial [Syntrophales bacterium]|nr:translation initiation factor IF-2 N-terminal domain-containing protein [Syntrophales bacterium]
MTKKRVHELAKELTIESKYLIDHLKTLGIEVKSHQSSLEDGDVERVKRLLRAKEPHDLIEKRVKDTVIRRRVVHKPVEEKETSVVEAGELRTDSDKTETPSEPAKVSRKTVAKERVSKVHAPKEVVQTEALRQEISPEDVSVPRPISSAPTEVPAEKIGVADDLAAAKPAFPRKASTAPAEKPPEEGKLPAAQPRPAHRPQEAKRAPYAKTGLAVSKASVLPLPVEKPQRDEEEKPRKKSRAPVEVLIEEQPPARKKAFVKKIVEKKT